MFLPLPSTIPHKVSPQVFPSINSLSPVSFSLDNKFPSLYFCKSKLIIIFIRLSSQFLSTCPCVRNISAIIFMFPAVIFSSENKSLPCSSERFIPALYSKCAHLDSNQGPVVYKTTALPTELWAHFAYNALSSFQKTTALPTAACDASHTTIPKISAQSTFTVTKDWVYHCSTSAVVCTGNH
jgi:hypothetical protein